MRWGTPEAAEKDDYQLLTIDGASIYVNSKLKGFASARIDLVTGGAGTKLIFLGFAGKK